MKRFFVLLLALLSCASARPALADLRYSVEASRLERENDSDPYSPMRISHTRRTYLMTAGKERVEETMQFQTYPFHLNTIFLADGNQVVHLAPELHIYTVEPLDPRQLSHLLPWPRHYAADGTGKVGSSVTTYNVTDKGEESLHGQKTHRYMITATTTENGCLGSHQATVQADCWVVPLDLGTGFPASPTSWKTIDEHGCTISYEERGDVEKLRTIERSAILSEKMTVKDHVGGSAELVNYDTSHVDYSLFTIPPNYKKVERAEFRQAVEQGLLKAMLHGSP